MEMAMVPILVENKRLWIFIFLLSQLICGNTVLHCRGKTDTGIHISTNDLCDFNFELNGRVPKEILDQFNFADSIGAYYYKSANTERPFDTIYIWPKRGRIKKISLSSNIDLHRIHSEEEYRAEYVRRIIEDRYNDLGIPDIQRFTFKKVNKAGAVYFIERKTITWVYKNIKIEYSYLPYHNFDNEDYRMEIIIGDRDIGYELRITLLD
jgi:hypothetical protein